MAIIDVSEECLQTASWFNASPRQIEQTHLPMATMINRLPRRFAAFALVCMVMAMSKPGQQLSVSQRTSSFPSGESLAIFKKTEIPRTAPNLHWLGVLIERGITFG
jgi:hypothetical protein